MESNCVASGGTFFGAPLDYIDKILKNPLKKISDLQVLFLTDVEDNDSNRTSLVCDNLSQTLINQDVYAKFSVIGLGEYDAKRLNSLLELGTERGLFTNISNDQPQEVKQKKIQEFFE